MYLDGESFALQVATTDARGEPIGPGAHRRRRQAWSTRRAGSASARSAQDRRERSTRRARRRSRFRIDDAQGGNYVLRVAGTDRFGNPIVADRAIFVSGKKDETKLRILADRQQYKVGEEASVNLHSRGRSGTAILTWEADRILTYRLVPLQEGDNPVAWAVDGGSVSELHPHRGADVAKPVRRGEARCPGRA